MDSARPARDAIGGLTNRPGPDLQSGIDQRPRFSRCSPAGGSVIRSRAGNENPVENSLIDSHWVLKLRVTLRRSDLLSGRLSHVVSSAVCLIFVSVLRLPRALDELHRVLCAGGRALILDTGWDSLVWHTSGRGLH
jgi:hypothetical protein